MENIRLYLRESYDELINHVTWPTWDELLSSGKLVVVGTIILSLLIFAFDFISNNALKALYNL
ncbi:MAG: preprotein translocase subunit SecE [Saprospiraceae bacterium]|nr:preprotein translocase subunit SecE [Saprospiraceae bacterium]